jgi:hypothetical protein
MPPAQIASLVALTVNTGGQSEMESVSSEGHPNTAFIGASPLFSSGALRASLNCSFTSSTLRSL